MDQIKKANCLAMISLEYYQANYLADSGEMDVCEEQVRVLTQLLRRLSLQDVRLLELKYYQGLGMQLISQQLNLNPSAAKMRLKRCRDKVRQSYYVQLGYF